MIHIAYHLRHDAAPRDQIHAQWPHLREGETDPRRNLVALRPIVAFTFTDEFVVLVEHDHRLRESTLQCETHSGDPYYRSYIALSWFRNRLKISKVIPTRLK